MRTAAEVAILYFAGVGMISALYWSRPIELFCEIRSTIKRWAKRIKNRPTAEVLKLDDFRRDKAS